MEILYIILYVSNNYTKTINIKISIKKRFFHLEFSFINNIYIYIYIATFIYYIYTYLRYLFLYYIDIYDFINIFNANYLLI
jgi:hypothetical protein